MKLQFKKQQFQEDATNAVCDVFEGQPRQTGATWGLGYEQGVLLSTGRATQQTLALANTATGNAPINAGVRAGVETAIARIQEQGGIDSTQNVRGAAILSLEVEMETGTGKTYTYTKTIFELNKRYGWTRFIVIVPSVAIREGVAHSLGATADEFQRQYGAKAQVFVYRSDRLADIRNFADGSGLQVMVMNYQAFAARGEAARRISMEFDGFGSLKPLDVIAKTNPILILDEPQKMEGRVTQGMFPKFNPLFILKYSATHRTIEHLVYRLDAIDAFEKKLVKRIAPVCLEVKNKMGGDDFLYCSTVRPGNPAPEAVLEFNVKSSGGDISAKTRVVRTGDDIHILSGGLAAYQGGYVVTEINAKPGFEKVVFANGDVLGIGDMFGGIETAAYRRVQIREAIKAHLQKEIALYPKGIKALTLFFIDAVANYRDYGATDGDTRGVYAKMFEEEYAKCVEEALYENGTVIDPGLKQYWESIKPNETHDGYFAKDKKGRFVDKVSETDSGKKDKAESAAYDLILTGKERLLSFDDPQGGKLRFIFSHSALREGWDNPNVFVICLLKEPKSEDVNVSARRQEVGRGLRLCVNQQGVRQDAEVLGPNGVHDLNELTIVTNESFGAYAAGLQKDYEEACKNRPKEASVEFFIGKPVVLAAVGDGTPTLPAGEAEGKRVMFARDEAKVLHNWLVRNDFIDDDDRIQPTWRAQRENLPSLPAALAKYTSESVAKLVDAVNDPSVFRQMVKESKGGKTTLVTNRNFEKREFQQLWAKINRQSVYRVDMNFDTPRLVRDSIATLDSTLQIPPLMVRVVRGEQTDGTTFGETQARTETVKISEANANVRYDLVGSVAAATKLTKETVAEILKGVHKDTFAQFANNPEKFIAEVSRTIRSALAEMVIEHVSYAALGEDRRYEANVFLGNQIARSDMKILRDDRQVLQKHIYDYLFQGDGSDVEVRLAKAMEVAEEVVVYAKLPHGFFIPTPVGDYSPDWAIVFDRPDDKRQVYFIAETKGTSDESKLRGEEAAKIACARKHFAAICGIDVTYDVVKDYHELLNKVMGV